MPKSLSTELSKSLIRFKPEGEPTCFEVTVQNDSDEFATFQLELTASGVDAQAETRWYQLSPDVSSKIPGGDRVRFTVSIVDVPPVPGGFAGTMTLTVRVFSLELRDEDRQVLKLVIEGSGVMPPKLDLPNRRVQGYPGESIEIPVMVYNMNRHSALTQLRLYGLELSWLADGSERRLQVPPGNTPMQAFFLCQIPTAIQAPSSSYPFTIEANHPQSAAVRIEGTLTVLPSGYIEFSCSPLQQVIPSGKGWFRNWGGKTAEYSLVLQNLSNLVQPVRLDVHRQGMSLQSLMVAGGDRAKAQASMDKQALLLEPQEVKLEVGDTQTATLTVRRKRPWWGWSRQLTLEAKAIALDERLDLRNDTQTLKLKVRPLFPLWFQFAAVGLLLFLFWLPQRLLYGHRDAVNTVQIDGLANEVISGSDDQTVRRWEIRGNRLRSLGMVERADKAVRVVSYRPINNNTLAIGFENGQIQIWDLLTNKLQRVLLRQRDDRVFSLVFTPDSQVLFSGHGSGRVLAWDVSAATAAAEGETQTPVLEQQVGFAVQALALIGQDNRFLAIAGRFNRLMLWDLADPESTPQPLTYAQGGANDYIYSLAAADQRPELLAAADNQGRITLWNLDTCQTSGDCLPVDQLTDGHGGTAVQALAFSGDGCYLTSGGEDGQVMLWSLSREGQIDGGEEVVKFDQPINAVDVVRLENRVLVVSGGDNHRVDLRRVGDDNLSCP